MELLLIRHALPIRREVVDGPADPPLSEAGLAQAALLGSYLASEKLDAIYSSPLARAQQTAAPVAAAQGLAIVIEDGVAEYDRLSNEYIPIEEIKAAGGEGWKEFTSSNWHGAGAFSSPEEFNAIIIAAVEGLVARHRGHRIAVVCHGGVINGYLAHVLGIEGAGFFYPNYTSIHRIAAAGSGERSIVTINETSHLRGSGLPMGIVQRG
jgi:probable phosphoglycerate mutase